MISVISKKNRTLEGEGLLKLFTVLSISLMAFVVSARSLSMLEPDTRPTGLPRLPTPPSLVPTLPSDTRDFPDTLNASGLLSTLFPSV